MGSKQKLTLEEGGAFEVKTSHTTLEMDGSPLMNPFMANIYPPEAEKNPAEAKPITKSQIEDNIDLLNFLNRHTDTMFKVFGSIVEKGPNDPKYGIKNRNGEIEFFDTFEKMHESITQNPMRYMQTDVTPESGGVHPLQQATPGTAEKVIRIQTQSKKNFKFKYI